MPLQHHLPLLTIMITLITAILIPLFKNIGIAKKISIISISLVIILSLFLNIYLYGFSEGYFTYQLGHFSAPWGNELRAGLFEGIMAFVLSAVMLLSILGGLPRIEDDIKEDKRPYYYLMLNLLLGSMLALVYTNDIFTAYVFIEINAVAACAIVVAKESGDTIKATLKYFVMSALGSGLYLFAVSILYSISGHLLMSNMHEVIQVIDKGYEFPLTVAMVLIVVGLAVKSALFPFHTWLPDAHSSATSSASAILSGLVLKGYIILLIKIIYRVYGIEVVRQLGLLNILIALGILGMLLGSLYALIQKDLKKMIAYSSVAQIGYIYLAIGLGTEAGLLAAGFHIIVHAVTKSMLFISSGNLIKISRSHKIEDLDGLGYKDKLSGISFLVGGLSMIGLPLLAGFISKVLFIQAGLEGSLVSILVLVALAVSTLLNAMYYLPVIIRIFKKSEDSQVVINSGLGKLSLISLIVINIILGVFSQPLLKLLEIGMNNLV